MIIVVMVGVIVTIITAVFCFMPSADKCEGCGEEATMNIDGIPVCEACAIYDEQESELK